MAGEFEPGAPVIATKVRALDIRLRAFDKTIGTGNDYLARFSFDRVTDDGKIVDVREGNAIEYFTPTEQAQLIAMMDRLFALAKTTV